jgi:hypothetical protein
MMFDDLSLYPRLNRIIGRIGLLVDRGGWVGEPVGSFQNDEGRAYS